MINEFVKNTTDMLYRSDIKIHIPSFNKIELNGESRTLFLELNEFVGQIRLEDNLIFCSMIFFTLIDTYIDIKYPDLEGYSFAKKYRKLPRKNDKDIMIREIYRLLKIIRNATIHSRNSIEFKADNEIIIDYIHKSTNFHLSVSKLGLELIYTLILLYLDQSKYSDTHQLGLLRKIYDDILSTILKISDDFGQQNLNVLSNGVRLRRLVRYVVTNPEYTMDTDKGLVIINRIKFQDDAIDYIIQDGNNRYIIPEEVLNEEGIFEIGEMQKWKLQNDCKRSLLFNL